MTLKILNKKEKQEILEKLNKEFGITEISGILIAMGKERIFLFSGSFDEKQLKKLEKLILIERVGIYFAKTVNAQIKLSIEGSQALKNQIKKNIFSLNEQRAEQWMKGQELDIQTGKRGFLIMKYKNDFLGCGKASEKKIGNFIPKSRRLKEKS